LSGSLEFLSGRWADRSQPKSYGFAKTAGVDPWHLPWKHWSPPTEFWDKAGYGLIFGLLASAVPASPNSALDTLRNVKTKMGSRSSLDYPKMRRSASPRLAPLGSNG
jgi:hypothetical protein